ncbi:acyl-CoA carboxylase subunit epsilon [Jiangella rhizosphaerae]|uniref:Acyl-CoA carboxylase subunit epsilon n=1 Tax=Jiangella rhizosphaerae TaxID=2293569 RepID=A0A418KSJ0_9ACTN|nr:acyl-CoA carboxylase subunit epsilon [Jiangella rhizosphaerae]RIQ27377.1 acyl-CoA carboxylase subunit epsilon [Jiangella rhizosphaerae]
MSETPPLFRVVNGTPTDEELAALVVVLTAKAAGGRAPSEPPRSAWSSYWSTRRAPLAPGAGAWRASALPR